MCTLKPECSNFKQVRAIKETGTDLKNWKLLQQMRQILQHMTEANVKATQVPRQMGSGEKIMKSRFYIDER